MQVPESTTKKLGLWLVVLFVPAYLNDFAYAIITGASGAIVLDYGYRLFVVAVFAFVPELRKLVERNWRPTVVWWRVALWIAGALVVSLFGYKRIEWYGDLWAGFWHYIKPLAAPPAWLRQFDLWIGLPAVAVTEELVGRVLFLEVARRYSIPSIVVVLLSSVVFALAHWGGGGGSVLATFVAGIVLMVVYLKTGSFVPCVIVHWAIDFQYYW